MWFLLFAGLSMKKAARRTGGLILRMLPRALKKPPAFRPRLPKHTVSVKLRAAFKKIKVAKVEFTAVRMCVHHAFSDNVWHYIAPPAIVKDF